MAKTRLHQVLKLIAGCCFWQSCAFAESPSETDSLLIYIRRAGPEIFTLEVEVDRRVHAMLAGQGTSTRRMRITVDKETTAMVWKTTHFPVPKYYPPDTPSYQPADFDEAGNLHLSMWTEGATIRDQSIHEEYSESTGFDVSPAGNVLGQSAGALLQRRLASDTNTAGMYLLRVILWGLGRPPAELLGEMESERINADGTYDVRLSGRYSPYFHVGVWNLVVDPVNGHLVRKGTFGTEENARLQVRSEGTRRINDVMWAERGEFINGSDTISVRLISFSPTLSDEIVNEARSIIARANTRLVQLIDYRVDQDRPQLRTVQAGELDMNK